MDKNKSTCIRKRKRKKVWALEQK